MSKIQFISMTPGLSDIEWARPKPAKQFIPEWFKNIPNDAPTSVKKCPSFPDYFSQGFIIPMWMDSMLSLDKENGGWRTESSKMFHEWGAHAPSQLLDYVESSHLGNKTDFVFKANAPWRIITEPGWSVLQLPVFYNFNKNWTVLPGVIDTDIHHEINIQVLYHGKNKENVLINAGEAFVVYIPFKRQKIKLDVRDASEQEARKIEQKSLEIHTKFFPTGVYRRQQRERDKDKKGFLKNLKNRIENV